MSKSTCHAPNVSFGSCHTIFCNLHFRVFVSELEIVVDFAFFLLHGSRWLCFFSLFTEDSCRTVVFFGSLQPFSKKSEVLSIVKFWKQTECTETAAVTPHFWRSGGSSLTRLIYLSCSRDDFFFFFRTYLPAVKCCSMHLEHLEYPE